MIENEEILMQHEPSMKRQCLNQSNIGYIDFIKLMEDLNSSDSSSSDSLSNSPSLLDNDEENKTILTNPPVSFESSKLLSHPPVMLSHAMRPLKRKNQETPRMVQLTHPQSCFKSCLTTIISGKRNVFEAHVCAASIKLGFFVEGEYHMHDDTTLGIAVNNVCGLASSRLTMTPYDEKHCARSNIMRCDGVLILKNKSDAFLNEVNNFASFGVWENRIYVDSGMPPKPTLMITTSLQSQFGDGKEQILLPCSTWLDDINQIYNFLMIHKIRCLYITGNDDDGLDPLWYNRIINFLKISLDRFKTI